MTGNNKTRTNYKGGKTVWARQDFRRFSRPRMCSSTDRPSAIPHRIYGL